MFTPRFHKMFGHGNLVYSPGHPLVNMCMNPACIITSVSSLPAAPPPPPESGHAVDHQSDPEPVHGGLPALLAPEEAQQEDDPQSPASKTPGGQRAPSGRPGPAGGRHEHLPGTGSASARCAPSMCVCVEVDMLPLSP